jgi:hypothetical protein
VPSTATGSGGGSGPAPERCLRARAARFNGNSHDDLAVDSPHNTYRYRASLRADRAGPSVLEAVAWRSVTYFCPNDGSQPRVHPR